MKTMPDEIRFSDDPDIRVRMSTPEGYKELLNEHGVEDDADVDDLGTPPAESGEEPPPDGDDGPPKTDDPPAEPDKDTPPEDDAEGAVFTEDETKKLQAAGIISQDGKFLGKYGTVGKMLKAIEHKDRAISSKFGEWIEKNPDAARELLQDAGVVETVTPATQDQDPPKPEEKEGAPTAEDAQEPPQMPGQQEPPPTDAPTPEMVEQILSQTMPSVEDVLAEQFKDELEELGIDIPKDRKEWRDLADMSPGLHAEMREAHTSVSAEHHQTKQLLMQAAEAVSQRRNNRESYEQKLLEDERKALTDAGYPEDLVTKTQDELLSLRKDDYNVDLTYYDDLDRFQNRIFVPTLRPGALKSYITGNHSDALMQARVDAAVQQKLSKERSWREGKERRAGLFPATIVGGTGEGKQRTAVHHPTPTPEEYWDHQWRDQNLRTDKDRNAVRDWITGLPADERDKYRNPS